MTPYDARQRFEQEIARLTAAGWQIVSRTDSAVQLRHARQWNTMLLAVGTVALLFAGAGLIILLMAVADYLLKGDRVIYFTLADIERGQLPQVGEPINPLILVSGAILFVLACGFVGLLALSFIGAG